jgi:Sulfate permease family
VARSSANITFGGRTRWANFFHGFFLLVAMIAFIPLIEMIPNTALAALLISVGYRLASPNEFFKTYKIGSEQLVIFVTTVIVTVATDLLVGVGAGILMKFFFHILNGAPVRSLFKARYELYETPTEYHVKVKDAAIFSNLIGFEKLFNRFKPGRKVIVNFEDARIVDHSMMETLHHFEEEYHHQGGHVALQGFDNFRTFSNHPFAARKFDPEAKSRIEIKLSPRQMELRAFAESNEYTYYPQRIRSAQKYKNFPLQRGHQILSEENILEKYLDIGRISVSDVMLTEGVRSDSKDHRITLVLITETDLAIPDFALEPEGLLTKFSELAGNKDIDFKDHPEFSKKYFLRGDHEDRIRAFFGENIVQFLENREEIHIECHKNKLLFYKKRELLETGEILYTEKFAEDFLQLAAQQQPTPA